MIDSIIARCESPRLVVIVRNAKVQADLPEPWCDMEQTTQTRSRPGDYCLLYRLSDDRNEMCSVLLDAWDYGLTTVIYEDTARIINRFPLETLRDVDEVEA